MQACGGAFEEGSCWSQGLRYTKWWAQAAGSLASESGEEQYDPWKEIWSSVRPTKSAAVHRKLTPATSPGHVIHADELARLWGGEEHVLRVEHFE